MPYAHDGCRYLNISQEKLPLRSGQRVRSKFCVEMEGTSITSFHSLESLEAEDRKLFNYFSRGPTVPVPYKIVHHAFEAIANHYPDVIAVRHCDGTTISYAELDQRANILANELHYTYGIHKGDRVILVYSRCIEMVVFILAVLKAGGQYVPLDGTIIPEETLKHDISDSGAPVVLCLPKFCSKVEQSMPNHLRGVVKVVELDSRSSIWETGNRTRLIVDVGPSDGAYVIYTSGTTGKPKGVDVKHEGLTNTLLTEPSKLKITTGRNVSQLLNVAFDLCRHPSNFYRESKTFADPFRRLGNFRNDDEWRYLAHSW